MSDYSDILMLIGAIAIYAILVTNTNRTMLMNDQMLTTTEVEYGAISVAQDVITQAKWLGFNAYQSHNHQATENKLEDINDKPEMYDVEVVISDAVVNESPGDDKKLKVMVTSKYLGEDEETPYSITLSYLKTDY